MQSFHQIWHHNNEGDLYWMGMDRVIGAARAGDQQAIAKLYNAYSHKVLGICYNIVGNRAVAEKLAHDAFVLAFSKLDQLNSPNRFDAWLSSIASNVALRYKQRHHALATVPVDDMPDGKVYCDCPIGNSFSPDIHDLISEGKEFILYDFNDPVAYWNKLVNQSGYNDQYQHLYTDTISLGTHLAKQYVGNLSGGDFRG